MSDLPTVSELRASKPHLTPVVTWKVEGEDEERVIYGLQPKQLEARNLTPLGRKHGEPGPVHIGFGGAAGPGKSYWARVIATSVAMTWPGSSTLIYRETEGDVKKNHVEPFKLEVPQYISGEKLWTYNGNDMCLTWFNGSKTYFGYLKHDEDVKRAQGPAFDCMIFEEATFYTWFMIAWLTGNRLRSSVEGTTPFALYPSNPGGRGMAWYKRLFIQRRFRGEENPEDYAFVQAKLDDNIELKIRDPRYGARLNLLPEPHRSWQRDGNFAAGAGSAFSNIDWKRHLVDPFPIPDYWLRFGSFDWGYRHPFSFGDYTVTEDGALFKIETVTGVRLLPHEQIERIKSIVPVEKLHYVVSGHDAWQRNVARGENIPTIQEAFFDAGILLSKANIDRPQGLQQLRKMLDWSVSGPFIDGVPTEGDPSLRFFDTKNNRTCLEQMENMAEDPANAEDVLKMNADDFGEHGDDMYDETRYACASRPPTPDSSWAGQAVNPWAPAVLEHEMKEQRRVKRHRDHGKGLPPDAVT